MHNHGRKLFLPISLASLFIGPSSWAQSSVTLFGVVDISVSHYQTKSVLPAGLPWWSLAAPTSISQGATKLASGAHTPSLLGIRGQEDLGGGLAAGFWLESTLTPDDGAQGLGVFDRRSTVSLSGPFGEVRLGRDYVPTYWNLTVFDPFGTVGVGANLWNPIGTGLTTSHGKSPANLMPFDNYVRASNSVGYFLPGNVGGFYGQVMYSLHENLKQSGVSHSPSKGGRNVGGRFGYQRGPLNLAIAYQEDTKDDLSGFDKDRLKILNAGVSYDFDVIKLFGQLSQIRDERSKMNVANIGGIPHPFRNESNGKYTGGLIGITAPVGPRIDPCVLFARELRLSPYGECFESRDMAARQRCQDREVRRRLCVQPVKAHRALCHCCANQDEVERVRECGDGHQSRRRGEVCERHCRDQRTLCPLEHHRLRHGRSARLLRALTRAADLPGGRP
ncbi:porin [Variovorax boronicumulans]